MVILLYSVYAFLFILFNELSRFLDEMETAILTVSNSEIITLDLTVSKNRVFVKHLLCLLIK